MRLLICFILIISVTSCDYSDDRLKIRNNTNNEIFYSFTKSDLLIKNPLYIEKNDTVWENSNIVLPNTHFNHLLIGSNEWEYFINRDCEDSLLTIFFFTKDLVVKNSWYSLVHNQVYTKKIRISVEDLKKDNWEVIYK